MTENNLGKYRDFGITAQAEEPRTSCIVLGSDGYHYLVICSRRFLMVVNMEENTSEQIMYPENHIGYPFGSLGTKSGMVYLGAGTMFMEFDPVKRFFRFYSYVHPELAFTAWNFAQAADGKIYFGSYPVTYLNEYNPKTKEIKTCGILDETQEYTGTVAIDKFGYVYVGIGSQTSSIVVYNPQTESKSVIPMPEGDEGDAFAALGKDGEVYINFSSSLSASEFSKNKIYYRVEKGEICEKITDIKVENYVWGSGFYAVQCPLEKAPKIIRLDLAENIVTYINPITDLEVSVELKYISDGADMSPLTLGPDGKIYGTTNHPIQIYTYDDETDKLTNYGKQPFSKGIQLVSWGNICAYASQGSILGGIAYSGGHVVRIDTKKEICTNPAGVNPYHECSYNEIMRPRSAVAYSDGKTLIFGGFATDGKTGGGLVLYDVNSRETRLIKNEQLVLWHSVMSMVTLPSGEVLCGTTIEAPFGGRVYENEAVLFGLDIENTKVLYQVHPIEGATEISHMKLDHNGIVHAITAEGIYFSYDPVAHTVLKKVDLSQYGEVVRDGMQIADDGMIYGLMFHAIYRINPDNGEVDVISEPPCTITSGMAIKNGKIYFGGDTHFWSYTI